MTPDDLARSLRMGDDQRRDRTLGCPDEQRVAAYVDGALGPEDRRQLELHLADCGHCLALVGLLGRDRGAEPAERVPEAVLARAHKLADNHDHGWLRAAPRWAAAAAVVLISIPVLLQVAGPPGGAAAPSSGHEARVTRSVAVDPLAPGVLQPAAGAKVDPDGLIIRWAGIPGSDYYDVRILTDAGALIVEQRVTGTEWRPTAPLKLDRGAEYFVQVDAYPADGKAVSSAHVPFRTVE